MTEKKLPFSHSRFTQNKMAIPTHAIGFLKKSRIFWSMKEMKIAHLRRISMINVPTGASTELLSSTLPEYRRRNRSSTPPLSGLMTR